MPNTTEVAHANVISDVSGAKYSEYIPGLAIPDSQQHSTAFFDTTFSRFPSCFSGCFLSSLIILDQDYGEKLGFSSQGQDQGLRQWSGVQDLGQGSGIRSQRQGSRVKSQGLGFRFGLEYGVSQGMGQSTGQGQGQGQDKSQVLGFRAQDQGQGQGKGSRGQSQRITGLGLELGLGVVNLGIEIRDQGLRVMLALRVTGPHFSPFFPISLRPLGGRHSLRVTHE